MPEDIPWFQRLTITIDDARLITGLGRNSLLNLIKAGKLRSVKLVGRRLVTVESLRALIEERAGTSYDSTKKLMPWARNQGRRKAAASSVTEEGAL